jgi:hypothetical protein
MRLYRRSRKEGMGPRCTGPGFNGDYALTGSPFDASRIKLRRVQAGDAAPIRNESNQVERVSPPQPS